MPFIVAYLMIMAIQLAVWFVVGMGWAAATIVFAGFDPVSAFSGGLEWAAVMWLTIGNLAVIVFMWKQSASFPAHDRALFREALEKVRLKQRMIVLFESPDEIILGPKHPLIRVQFIEIRAAFINDMAMLTTTAFSFSAIKKQLNKALKSSRVA